MWRITASHFRHSFIPSPRTFSPALQPKFLSSEASDSPPPNPDDSARPQTINPPPPFSPSPPSPRQNQSVSPPPVRQPSAPPGTDYLSLFQPSYGNALTGVGAFSPGSVLKISSLPRFVLKEDVIHHLRGTNVDPEKIKFVYNPVFRPDYVQLEVDSVGTQRQLMKRLQERVRLGCRFLKAEVSAPMPWTFVDAALKDSPRGQTLIMWNVPPSTSIEDVERFFQGYNYDARCIHIINVSNNQVQSRTPNRRPPLARPNLVHIAVGFTSKLEALRAMREKTGDFCLNAAINLRLIQ